MPFELFSTAFESGEPIPVRYTCDGEGITPPLYWNEPPLGTKSFVLVFEDLDAPGGSFIHWLLYRIPAHKTGLTEAVISDALLADGSMHGLNSLGKLGYAPPCPGRGVHRYFFRLYALDREADLAPQRTFQEVMRSMKDSIVGVAQLMGTYAREPSLRQLSD